MQVSEHVFFGLFSLIVLSLVFFNAKRPSVRRLPQDVVFGYIVLSCIMIVVLDILIVVFGAQPGPFFRFANYSLNILVRTIDLVPALLWVVYVCIHIFQDMRIVRKMTIPLIAAFLLNITFLISGIMTGWAYEMDWAKSYDSSPIAYARSVYAMSFLYLATAVAVVRRKNLEKRVFIGLVSFILPVSVGIVSQWFVNTTVFVSCGISISVLSAFINIQNKHLTRDYLTGIYNRFQLDHYIAQKIKRSAKRPFGAILLDLDGFKAINDVYGHQAGDEVLKTAVSLIGDCVDKEDFFARYGGDEFCVVLDMDKTQRLEKMADCIRQRIEAHNQKTEQSLHIGLSMGYSVYDDNIGTSAHAFLAHIDKLMYQNKKSR